MGEILFTAADGLGDGDRHVVGGTGDQRLDRVLDGDRVVLVEAELGGRLCCGARGNLEFGIELELAGFDLLEQQIERHDLGERGRVADRVRLGLVQHLAGLGIDDDGRVAGVPALGRRALARAGFGGRGEQGGYDKGRDQRKGPTGAA